MTARSTTAGVPVKKSKPLTSSEVLSKLGIDWLCEQIETGKSQREIADSLKLLNSDISKWLALDEKRSARVREARVISSRHWDEQAEAVLIAADEDKPGAITKARELASHYRWRAKCYAPKEYGDKVGVGGTDDLPPIDAVVTIRRVIVDPRESL
jgi:hypothetical protein